MSIPFGVSYPPRRVNFGWIGEAFDLFKANAGIWIVAVLLSAVPSLIGFVVGAVAGAQGAVSRTEPGENPFSSGQFLTGGLPAGLSLALRIFGTLYGAWLSGGVYRTAVKQVRGELISIGDLFSGGAVFLNMLAFNIVSGIAIGVGFVLCILPGLLLAGLLFPGSALIADGESFGNAFSRSWDGMKQDLWNAAVFALVMGLLVFASAIPCGLGLFVTVPMVYLVAALAYRDMIGMPGLGQPASPYGAAPGTWPPAPGAWPPPPNINSQPPQQYPGYPPSAYPPQMPPQQYPQVPPPAQQYPSVPPTQYPPAEPSEEPPANSWQPRPSPPPPPPLGE